MNDWREFRRVKAKRTFVWKIKQEGESYITESGQLDGKMQQFSDTPGPKGKPDTKAYVNALDNCTWHVLREIRYKEEEGYIEYINGAPVAEQVTQIDFDKLLPKQFTLSKPKTDIDPKALEKLYKAGKAKFTRKIDGNCSIVCHHTFGWQIYSRRMDLMTEKFPKHIEALRDSKFPVGTILVGEMVCLENGKESFKNISRLCRSLPAESRRLVESGEVPEATFVVFDCVFYGKSDLKDCHYADRFNDWSHLKAMKDATSEDRIVAIDEINVTPDTWESVAKSNGWEGFVVVDTTAVPGEKFYSFDGDAKRPSMFYKLKPVHTEDAVVYAAIMGTGKLQNTIGAVFVKQRHPDTGTWVDCGKIGSGFSEEARNEMLNLCSQNNVSIVEKDKDAAQIDLNEDHQLVIEFEYSERQPGTQKLRFPVFSRIRTDKSAAECDIQRLAPEEE